MKTNDVNEFVDPETGIKYLAQPVLKVEPGEPTCFGCDVTPCSKLCNAMPPCARGPRTDTIVWKKVL